MNISRIIWWAKRKYSEQTAVIFKERTWTYNQLLTGVQRYIRFFRDMDLARNRPVVVALSNTPEFVHISMALNALGIPMVLCHFALSSLELGYIFEDSKAQLFISYRVADDYLERLRAAGYRVPVIDIHKPSPVNGAYGFDEYVQTLAPLDLMRDLAEDAPSFIIYTSAEDGYLKGACLTYKSLLSNVLVSSQYMGLAPHEAVLPLLPFCHSFGLSTAMLATLIQGARLVLLDRFRLRHILKLIQQHRVARVISVPALYQKMFFFRDVERYDLSSITGCVTGGSPVPIELQKYARDKFHIAMHQGYGMTEASPVVAFNTFDQPLVFGSCGTPYPIFDLTVKDDAGRDAPKGETGELWIRGPSVIKSYYGAHSGFKQPFTANGWFKTGDLVRIDEKGYLFFTGLKKNMFLVGGYNVYPREVERIVRTFEGVRDCNLLLHGKDDTGGDILGATIRLTAKEKQDHVDRMLMRCLSPYKIPYHVDWQYP